MRIEQVNFTDRDHHTCAILCSQLALCMCSALAVLASSSGVSSERTAFMDLVKTEIDRLNESIGKSGSVTMIFQRGNIRVRPPFRGSLL